MNCNIFLRSKGSQSTALFILWWKMQFRAGRVQKKRNLVERMDAFQNRTELDVGGRSLQQCRFDT